MFDYTMLPPVAVGAMRFAAAMAEYYGEVETDVDVLEDDLFQIINAHHEPLFDGEPREALDLAKLICKTYTDAIRDRQRGGLPWYGPTETG